MGGHFKAKNPVISENEIAGANFENL